LELAGEEKLSTLLSMSNFFFFPPPDFDFLLLLEEALGVGESSMSLKSVSKSSSPNSSSSALNFAVEELERPPKGTNPPVKPLILSFRETTIQPSKEIGKSWYIAPSFIIYF
jgi:hypothetical protein